MADAACHGSSTAHRIPKAVERRCNPFENRARDKCSRMVKCLKSRPYRRTLFSFDTV